MQVNSQFYYKSKNLRIKSLRDNNMSHNQMSTFFSGTDTNTLLEEGKDRNNFVSLIVNNKGTYTAAITRMVRHETIMQDTISYKFFNKGEIKSEADVMHESSEEVEYFYLNIQIEGGQAVDRFIDERLKEIADRKKESVQAVPPFGKRAAIGRIPSNSGIFAGLGNRAYPRNTIQTTLWSQVSDKAEFDDGLNDFTTGHEVPFKDDAIEIDDRDGDKGSHTADYGTNGVIPFGDVHFDKAVVSRITKQLITCSLVAGNSQKINLDDWVAKMPTIFKNLFKNDGQIHSKYDEWAEFICYFLITGCRDVELDKIGYIEGEQEAVLAYDVMCNLFEHRNKVGESGYINSYIEVLENYISDYSAYC